MLTYTKTRFFGTKNTNILNNRSSVYRLVAPSSSNAATMITFIKFQRSTPPLATPFEVRISLLRIVYGSHDCSQSRSEAVAAMNNLLEQPPSLLPRNSIIDT